MNTPPLIRFVHSRFDVDRLFQHWPHPQRGTPTASTAQIAPQVAPRKRQNTSQRAVSTLPSSELSPASLPASLPMPREAGFIGR